MEFKFNVGDNVVYKKDTPDSKLATIFKKRYNGSSPSYLIYKIEDKTALDLVLEIELTESSKNNVIDHFWDKLIYTGDNLQASNYVINNILKNLGNVDNVSWGPSDDGTKYVFEIKNENRWEKTKTEEESA